MRNGKPNVFLCLEHEIVESLFKFAKISTAFIPVHMELNGKVHGQNATETWIGVVHIDEEVVENFSSYEQLIGCVVPSQPDLEQFLRL